jgi:dCTP deaminase
VTTGILSDWEIRACRGMILPFERGKKRPGVISYGCSHYGYDIRVASNFKIFTNVHSVIVDPKNINEASFVDFVGDVCVIPPNSYALCESVERFSMPHDVVGVCVGKSTYARCGIIVNVTPLEPGWEGILTIEISNSTPLPAKVYANEGIAQVIFFRGQMPDSTYASKGGKYHNQDGLTLPMVDQ